ncbi:MAG: DUF3237 domain-containing protein [Salaquimonas sp.]|jgi:hypothetical protein|nr:DUF3237 domain-containing protein [Salaquimonas sp.]
MKTPGLEHLCTIRSELGQPMEKGDLPGRRVRIIPIRGGTVTGERLKGRVLDFGADWQTVYEDGYAELDTRYVIETHDGALIDIRNFGFRHGPPEVMARVAAGEEVDPALYYMRTTPKFETGDERYQWLNRMLFIGTGARFANSVVIEVYEVL